MAGGFASRLALVLACVLAACGVARAQFNFGAPFELDKDVHFITADKRVERLVAGSYLLLREGLDLRIVPADGGEGLLAAAALMPHDQTVGRPIALSVPGRDEYSDVHLVVLLMPGGEALRATGTYSGVVPRGLWDDVKSGASSIGGAIGDTASDVGGAIGDTASDLASDAGEWIEEAADDVSQFAKESYNAAADAMDDAWDALSDCVTGESSSECTQAALDVARGFEAAWEAAEDAAEWLYDQATQYLQELMCKAMVGMMQGAEWVAKLSGPVAEKVADWTAPVTRELEGRVASLASDLDLDELSQEMGALFQESLETLPPQVLDSFAVFDELQADSERLGQLKDLLFSTDICEMSQGEIGRKLDVIMGQRFVSLRESATQTGVQQTGSEVPPDIADQQHGESDLVVSAPAAIHLSCADFQSSGHRREALTLATGDKLKVTLCSNPSTGYRWAEPAWIEGADVLQPIDVARRGLWDQVRKAALAGVSPQPDATVVGGSTRQDPDSPESQRLLREAQALLNASHGSTAIHLTRLRELSSQAVAGINYSMLADYADATRTGVVSLSLFKDLNGALLLEQDDYEPEERAPGESPIVGAPGEQSWLFSAGRAGTARAEFAYTRSWESDEAPIWFLDLVVEVERPRELVIATEAPAVTPASAPDVEILEPVVASDSSGKPAEARLDEPTSTADRLRSRIRPTESAPQQSTTRPAAVLASQRPMRGWRPLLRPRTRGEAEAQDQDWTPSTHQGQETRAGTAFAQTFTVGKAGLLNTIALRINREAWTHADLTVAVRRVDDFGRPSMDPAATLFTTTLPSETFPMVFSEELTEIDVSPGGISVQPGDQLAVIVSTAGVVEYEWMCLDGYTRGRGYVFESGQWIDRGEDFVFQTDVATGGASIAQRGQLVTRGNEPAALDTDHGSRQLDVDQVDQVDQSVYVVAGAQGAFKIPGLARLPFQIEAGGLIRAPDPAFLMAVAGKPASPVSLGSFVGQFGVYWRKPGIGPYVTVGVSVDRDRVPDLFVTDASGSEFKLNPDGSKTKSDMLLEGKKGTMLLELVCDPVKLYQLDLPESLDRSELSAFISDFINACTGVVFSFGKEKYSGSTPPSWPVEVTGGYTFFEWD